MKRDVGRRVLLSGFLHLRHRSAGSFAGNIATSIDIALESTKEALSEKIYELPDLANKCSMQHEINKAQLSNTSIIKRNGDVVLTGQLALTKSSYVRY